MGSKGSLNSYCLLKMRMKEVEKSNKKKVQMETSKKDQNSSTNDSEPKPDVIILDESDSEKKKSCPSIPPVNKKEIPLDKKETPSGTKKKKVAHNVPVFIYGDFYCSLCDAHMNSEDMWNSHVIGKRHKKNLNKGRQESKYEDLDVKSSVEYELRNVKDPIVGLSYIQETRKREVGIPPLYACFLCQSNFATVPMAIDHLISMKHRLNYIKESNPDKYQLLDSTNLKKPQLEPIVTEMATKLEEKFGRGTVRVKQEKEKQLYVPTKQFIRIEDDVEKTPKSQKHFDVWKPVGNSKDKFLDNVKDCRLIIEERRKKVAISVEKTGMFKQSHSDSNNLKRHRLPSPCSRESYKRERKWSRNRYSSDEDCRSLSRSPSYEPQRSNSRSSRKVVYISPDDEGCHSRSSQPKQKDYSSSKNYSFLETENMQPNSSNSDDALKKFCLKMFALPGEIFLQFASLKLDTIQIKGVDDLTAFAKAIRKAQGVFHKYFSSDLQAILKEKMSHKTESSPLKTASLAYCQDAASSSEKKLDLSFFSKLTNKAEGKCSPSSVAFHPNSSPTYDSIPLYNGASSTMAPFSLPGLTSEHRQPYSAYNTEQSQYSHSPSSNNYPEYKYF